MKTQSVVLCGLVFLFGFTACNQTKTVPFDALFTGTYTSVVPDSVTCGPGGVHVVVDATGQSDLLDEFTAHFDFCVDSIGNYGYHGLKAIMVSQNGDTLDLTGKGRVIQGRMDDQPEYVVSYWRDTFEITGGTGKFAGATGGGLTDDYNSSKDQNSHHHWTGKIILKK